MNGREAEEMVAEARERAFTRLLRAKEEADAVIREAADEVAEIRREVLATTGVEIVEEPPGKPPTIHDVQLGALADLAVNCHHLLAAIELLSPHVQVGSTRTVGAVLKTGVDLPTAALAVHHLQQSGFCAPDEGGL